MPDARIPLAQRLKDALSRPLRILPDDDPEWITGGDSLWEPSLESQDTIDDAQVEESLTDRP